MGSTHHKYECNDCGRVDFSTKTLSRGLDLSGRQPKTEIKTNKNHTCNSCLRKQEDEFDAEVNRAILESEKKIEEIPRHVNPTNVWYEDQRESSPSGSNTSNSRLSSAGPVDDEHKTPSSRSSKPPAARTTPPAVKPDFGNTKYKKPGYPYPENATPDASARDPLGKRRLPTKSSSASGTKLKKGGSGTSRSKPSSQEVNREDSYSNPSDGAAPPKKPRVENPESSKPKSRRRAPANPQETVSDNFNDRNLYGSPSTQQGTRGPEQGYSRKTAPPPTTYQDTPGETPEYPKSKFSLIIFNSDEEAEVDEWYNSMPNFKFDKYWLCPNQGCGFKAGSTTNLITHMWSKDKNMRILCKFCKEHKSATLKTFGIHLRDVHKIILKAPEDAIAHCKAAEMKDKIVIEKKDIEEIMEKIKQATNVRGDGKLYCPLGCGRQEKPFEPDEEKSLRDHLSRVHFEKNPCSFCRRSFATLYNLQRHEKKHAPSYDNEDKEKE